MCFLKYCWKLLEILLLKYICWRIIFLFTLIGPDEVALKSLAWTLLSVSPAKFDDDKKHLLLWFAIVIWFKIGLLRLLFSEPKSDFWEAVFSVWFKAVPGFLCCLLLQTLFRNRIDSNILVTMITLRENITPYGIASISIILLQKA